MATRKANVFVAAALFFTLLATASPGLWLALGLPVGLGGEAAPAMNLFGLALPLQDWLTVFLSLSLISVVLMAVHLILNWPVLREVYAAMMPNTTARGLLAGLAALGALLLVCLPWLATPGPAPVQTMAGPTEAPLAATTPHLEPATPLIVLPARPGLKSAQASLRQTHRRIHARTAPPYHRVKSVRRPYHVTYGWAKAPRQACKRNWYASRRGTIRYF